MNNQTNENWYTTIYLIWINNIGTYSILFKVKKSSASRKLMKQKKDGRREDEDRKSPEDNKAADNKPPTARQNRYFFIGSSEATNYITRSVRTSVCNGKLLSLI